MYAGQVLQRSTQNSPGFIKIGGEIDCEIWFDAESLVYIKSPLEAGEVVIFRLKEHPELDSRAPQNHKWKWQAIGIRRIAVADDIKAANHPAQNSDSRSDRVAIIDHSIRLAESDYRLVLASYLIGEFKREQGIDLSLDKAAQQRMRDAAEEARVLLADAEKYVINLPFITATASGPKHFAYELSRSRLEQMASEAAGKQIRLSISEAHIKPDIAGAAPASKPQANVKKLPSSQESSGTTVQDGAVPQHVKAPVSSSNERTSAISYNIPKISLLVRGYRGGSTKYDVSLIVEFLGHILTYPRPLGIANYLSQIKEEPFFLVAATGLGKTVAAPVHVFLRMCEKYYQGRDDGSECTDLPRVFVVEPTIPIATNEMDHMNDSFEDFLKTQKSSQLNPSRSAEIFGCATSAKSRNPDAPIKFITTGVFAQMAKNNNLVPGADRIIIDEAHITIGQNSEVELAIALCRNRDIPVDYMSATVETRGIKDMLAVQNLILANKQSHKIWLHNMKQPMMDCIVDLVKGTLVQPDPNSKYFPDTSYPYSEEVKKAVLGSNDTAQGMLIIANSYASETSDINRIAGLIEGSLNKEAIVVRVVKLASAINRDPTLKADFEHRMEQIESEKSKYVIISTNVVEMGVTFPSLDFVVTMGSAFENIVVADEVLPRLAPLNVNSLYQRVGRVGRVRSGIGYITNEQDAFFSTYSDAELNSEGMKNEPIKLPFKTASLEPLALYSFEQKWEDPELELSRLNLPSRVHLSRARVEEFLAQRRRLTEMGLTDRTGLSERGQMCQPWIGMTDVGYAAGLEEALLERNDHKFGFFLVLAALFRTGLKDVQERHSDFCVGGSLELATERPFFVDEQQVELLKTSLGQEGYTCVETETGESQAVLLAHKHAITLSRESELVSLYRIMCYFANEFSDNLFGNLSELEYYAQSKALDQEAASMGLFGPNIRSSLNAIEATIKYINKQHRADYQLIHETCELDEELSLLTYFLPTLADHEEAQFCRELAADTTRILIRISKAQNDTNNELYNWGEDTEEKGGRRGHLKQGGTPLKLADGMILSAIAVPYLGDDADEGEKWSLIHLHKPEELN